ncbi:unnamed protein product, partial [Meganyctiphanes norvegica]
MSIRSTRKQHLSYTTKLIILRALRSPDFYQFQRDFITQYKEGIVIEQKFGRNLHPIYQLEKVLGPRCKINPMNKTKSRWVPYTTESEEYYALCEILALRVRCLIVHQRDEIVDDLKSDAKKKTNHRGNYCSEDPQLTDLLLQILSQISLAGPLGQLKIIGRQKAANIQFYYLRFEKPYTTAPRLREYNYQVLYISVHKHPGSTLVLSKVSRNDMGAYLCIASNGYPPSVSKRIVLNVQFSPVVVVPNQLMSTPRGINVTLDCYTEASPKAFTFWRYNDTMVMSGPKYHLAETTEGFKTWLKLTITQVGPEDFGKYQCYSRNSFGENDGQVNLHEMAPAVPRADKIKNNEIEENSIFVKSSHHGRSRSQNQLIFNGVDVSDGSSKGGSHHHDDNRINEDNRVNSISKHNSNDDKIEERLIDIFSGTSSSSRIHFHSSFLLLLLMMLLLPSILRGSSL